MSLEATVAGGEFCKVGAFFIYASNEQNLQSVFCLVENSCCEIRKWEDFSITDFFSLRTKKNYNYVKKELAAFGVAVYNTIDKKKTI